MQTLKPTYIIIGMIYILTTIPAIILLSKQLHFRGVLGVLLRLLRRTPTQAILLPFASFFFYTVYVIFPFYAPWLFTILSVINILLVVLILINNRYRSFDELFVDDSRFINKNLSNS